MDWLGLAAIVAGSLLGAAFGIGMSYRKLRRNLRGVYMGVSQAPAFCGDFVFIAKLGQIVAQFSVSGGVLDDTQLPAWIVAMTYADREYTIARQGYINSFMRDVRFTASFLAIWLGFALMISYLISTF
jgi:hypothetical protein